MGHEIKTATDRTEEYIEKIKEAISDCSAHEKNGILLEKLRYWHWSAIDWRNSYEEKIDRCLENIGKGTNE